MTHRDEEDRRLDDLLESLGDPMWIEVASRECEGPYYITPWLRRVAHVVHKIRRGSA